MICVMDHGQQVVTYETEDWWGLWSLPNEDTLDYQPGTLGLGDLGFLPIQIYRGTYFCEQKLVYEYDLSRR